MLPDDVAVCGVKTAGLKCSPPEAHGYRRSVVRGIFRVRNVRNVTNSGNSPNHTGIPTCRNN
jgi:hypothetical protein